MSYEDLMKERNDANRAGIKAYAEWRSKVVDCLCLELDFKNKEIMNDAFTRALQLCGYLSHDGFIEADDVYEIVNEFIDFYKSVNGIEWEMG